MKLRRLDVENYGLFHGQSFEFNPDFALVFGPNEAGKSTLLQLIREQLFGFKVQNPYAFDDASGEMAATAEFETSAGERLRFRRRKGRKDEVVGELLGTGREINAASLANLFGGATKELYEHVFGFSLEELTAGQKSLEDAKLSEALYGGGVGGLANFQHVQTELQAEADSLFTARGSKKIINGLLSQIKKQAKDLRDATVKPRDYQQLVRECGEAEAAAEQARSQLEELRGKTAHLARIADAVTPWLRLQQAQRELSQMRVPDGFPPDGAAAYSRSKVRRDEVAAEVAAIDQEMTEEADELSALQLAPEVVAREAEIRKLQQQITQIAGFRRDLPLRKQDSEAIKNAVLAKLRELHPEWDHAHLERFRATLAQRETIERLAGELEELERRKTAAAAEQRAVESSLNTIQQQLAQVQIKQAPDKLGSLLDQAATYQRDAERLQELTDEATELNEAVGLLASKLNAPLRASLDEAADLPVPMPVTVGEFRDRLKHAEDEVHDAQRRVNQTQDALDDKQEQLVLLDERAAVPDREQLLAKREQRDLGWTLIRGRLLDAEEADDGQAAKWLAECGANEAEPIAEALTETFEQTVKDSDELADERQAKAEQAAARDQLKVEMGRLAERLASQQQSLADCQTQFDTERKLWDAAWSDCPFTPLSPDAMLDWLRSYEELREARSRQRALRSRVDKLQSSITAFESELTAEFPNSAETPNQRIVRARQLAEAARDSAVRRQTYEEQLPQKQETLRTLADEMMALDANLEDWQARWQRLLDEFEFPHEWDVHVAAKILNGLAEARSEAEKSTDLDKRAGDMAGGIAAFELEVQRLCGAIAPDLSSFDAEHAMTELHSRLEAVKQSHRDDKRLRTNKAKLEKRLASKQEQLTSVEQEMKQLLDAAGTESEGEFERVAVSVQRHAELTRQCQAATNEINAIRGTEDLSKFTLALENTNVDSLATEQRRVEEDFKTADERFDAAFKQAALLEDRRTQLDGASRAAELALETEIARSELAAAVDRWAPLMLAQALMKRAIGKFEREHQPAMLADVQRLLSQMTLGRYTAIERKLDERGTLLVIDDSGARKAPHQLSTGTREQLYLAIRLAYIQHYCRDAEPLPIVMDDVLVNFDAERAKQTLKVLAETAADVQIVFLTCHEHIAEIVQDVLPQSQPSVLPGGELPKGSVLAMKAKSPTPAKA